MPVAAPFLMVLVGREGLEPPVSDESGFTVRAATNYRLPPQLIHMYHPHNLYDLLYHAAVVYLRICIGVKGRT